MQQPTPRFVRKSTPRHTFTYDSQLQELCITWPGLKRRFFDLAECRDLCDLLTQALPDEETTQGIGYPPVGSNYHDHLCRCPGCDPQPPEDVGNEGECPIVW
jgi:hypothetical protein